MQQRVVRTLRPGFRAEEQPDLSTVLAAVKEMEGRINTTFDAFKAQNDKELAELKKKGVADVVTTEHTDRINASMSEFDGQMKQLHSIVAALRVNGAGGDSADEETVAAKAHAKAFNTWARKGTGEAELGALQVKAALSTDSNPDGGYLVPVTLDAEIGRVQQMVSVMRSICTVTPISTKQYRRLHGLGGSASGWVGEKESRTATTTPTLIELLIEAMEIYAMPVATQEIIDDVATPIEAWLADEVGREFVDEEGDAFINGNGVKKPRGVLQYTFVANGSYAPTSASGWAQVGYIATGASGAFPTVSASVAGYDKLVDLYHAIKQGLRANASWLMADSSLQAVRKLKVNDGNYIYLPPTATEPASVLGKPVNIDDNMPAIAADTYSIGFGDWKRAYRIVDRMGVRVLRDPYSSKPNVQFYTTKRVGGGINDFEALKFLKFGS